MKEIEVSDSFLTLDVDSRKCQNIETYNDCKTRLYIKNMTQVCGCLPLSHIMTEEVCDMYKTIFDFLTTLKRMYCAQPKSRLSVPRLSPSTQIPA